MKAALLFFSLLSCSCAQKIWVKPGGTDAEFDQHLAEARYHASAATVGAFNSYSSPFLNSYQQMGESLGNGVVRGLEQQRLIRMYMEMKGWTLTTVPREKKAAPQSVMMPQSGTLYLEEGPNEEVGG